MSEYQRWAIHAAHDAAQAGDDATEVTARINDYDQRPHSLPKRPILSPRLTGPQRHSAALLLAQVIADACRDPQHSGGIYHSIDELAEVVAHLHPPTRAELGNLDDLA